MSFKFLQENKKTILDDDWYNNYMHYIPLSQRCEPHIHSFRVGVHNTLLALEYEGDMDMASVAAMVHDIINLYRGYVSINEQVIGFMEDYLNEHLSGRSILRLA